MDTRWTIGHPQTPQDWIEIRQICIRTAANAADLQGDRRPFFESYWIGPYQDLVPEWTWVIRRGAGGPVLGYLCSAPNTRAFERSRLWQSRLPLLIRLITQQIPWSIESKNWLRRSVGLAPEVERSFGSTFARDLKRTYPAHLHINLDPSAQGTGGGHLLMEALVGALRSHRIRGVHLYCGQGPVAFYRRQGFEILKQVAFGARATAVFAMGRKSGLD